MNKNQLIAKVTEITNRPDLAPYIQSSVEKAIRKCHMLDFFNRDLVEIILPAQLTQVQTLTANINAAPFSMFRDVSHVRYWDTINLIPGIYCKRTTADKLFDSYNLQKLDSYYLIGQTLTIQLNAPNYNALVGYYSLPDATLSDPQFSSWIANLMPDGIINLAAARVFKRIGHDGPAQQHAAMFYDGNDPECDMNQILALGAEIGH